jgi:hypothetical protein
MGDSVTVSFMRSPRLISWLGFYILATVLSAVCQTKATPVQQFVAATPEFNIAAGVAPLSPDLALATYERGLQEQSNELAGYTATSVIDAELPDSEQKAEFEMKRRYSAPAVLQFSPLRFTGDTFVKSNVIVRLLESEVEHVHRREQSQTAINSINYKFAYKGTAQIGGTRVHVYELKPREKRTGLFKGRIYVDASNGELVRAQGRIVKSPSFFIKKISFVQDYATIDGFTLPTHMHSEAETRLVGKAIVDITHRDYQPEFAGDTERRLQWVTLIDGTN